MAERSVSILRPGRRGDGSVVQRDLNDFLVGKEILRVECGARTDEEYSCARMVFRDGDQMLLIAEPVKEAVTIETGLRSVIHFLFQPRKQRRIVIPGRS